MTPTEMKGAMAMLGLGTLRSRVIFGVVALVAMASLVGYLYEPEPEPEPVVAEQEDAESCARAIVRWNSMFHNEVARTGQRPSSAMNRLPQQYPLGTPEYGLIYEAWDGFIEYVYTYGDLSNGLVFLENFAAHSCVEEYGPPEPVEVAETARWQVDYYFRRG